MKHATFLLSDWLEDTHSDPSSQEATDRFDFLSLQGKLFLFHETALIKQGSHKNKSMNYTLCKWLEDDGRIKHLANKEADRVVVAAVYDIFTVVETKLNILRKTSPEQYPYPNSYHEDEYYDNGEYSPDYNAVVAFPLGHDETIARIKYVNDLLADKVTVGMLSDKELGFLSNASGVVRLSANQKSWFLDIQSKINRIRAARA